MNVDKGWTMPVAKPPMPDVLALKAELAKHITEHYGVSFAIKHIVIKYNLHKCRHRGNAWIDDICRVHDNLRP